MKEICNTNLTTQETNIEVIKKNIYEIRGQRVMIDRDLAELYEVETRRLNEAMKRNVERFPENFMFQLNRKEFIFITLRYTTKIEENPNLISQFATSSWDGTRKVPYAFTELSIAILNTA